MRRTGNPRIVTKDGSQLLNRLELSEKDVLEDFLQENLHSHPSILPIEEIDPSFAPLISLGREIENIDNLFISPEGKITLVETKLWRSREATREVVAQVIDYAGKLSSLSYDQIEQSVKSAKKFRVIGDESLYSFIVKNSTQEVLPEAQFIDEVQKNLRNSRFLLLVVGDGIRENLEKILDYLHKQPQMWYTFSLVEIHIYENPKLFDGRLILPMPIAQTIEIPRAIVQVRTEGPAEVSVTIEEPNLSKDGISRRTLSENEFFNEVQDEKTKKLFKRLILFATENRAKLEWGVKSVSIRLPDPKGSPQRLSLFVLTTSGEIYTGWLSDQLKRISLDSSISYDFVKALASIFEGVTPNSKYPDSLSRNLKASELEAKEDDFLDLVMKTISRISEFH